MASVTPARKGSRVVIYIVVGLVVLIAALVAFVATRPSEFRVSRTAEVHAPPEMIFPLINDFHNWAQWSPFEKLDPEMKKTFDGPPAGVGASYSWTGNAQAGEGKMTIAESRPNDEVGMNLEFVKPFAAKCHVTFTLVPTGGGTKVSWKMDGTNNFIAKAMSLVMDMDQMIGKDFEEGLANLDKLAHEQAEPNK